MGKGSRQTRQETLDQIVERGRNERAAGQHHVARHFTNEQHAAIADGAGVTDSDAKATLLLEIETAAGWFLADYRSQDRQTPSTIEKEARAVEAAAGRLLRTLKIKEASDPCAGMPPGDLRERLEWAAHSEGNGEQEVQSLVASVGQLQKLATKARADAEKAKGSGEPRGAPLNNFIGNLLSPYTEATGRPVGVSSHPDIQNPYGPTLRFVRACLTGVSENFEENYPDIALTIRNLTDENLADRIQILMRRRNT